MKRILLATVFSLMISPVFAQDAKTLATEYVNLPEVQAMTNDMFSPEVLTAQFLAAIPKDVQLRDDQIQKIGVVLSEEMNGLRPQMEELMISSAAQLFSVEELKALIDFYSSEHGASIMNKMTPYMEQVMGQLIPQMQAVQVNMLPKIQQIVQE